MRKTINGKWIKTNTELIEELHQKMAELKEQVTRLTTQVELLIALGHSVTVYPPQPIMPAPTPVPISPYINPWGGTLCHVAGGMTSGNLPEITVWNATNRVDSQHYTQNVQ